MMENHIVAWEKLLQKLAAAQPVRRVVDSMYRGRARRRLAELDHLSGARSQVRTLLRLVHQAHATRFGRDHDFPRIRTISDFQRLVPLRTLFQLGEEYWASPGSLNHTTWPRLPVGALTDDAGDGVPVAPLSADTVSSFRTAALTALGLIGHARPRARLPVGHLLVVSDKLRAGVEKPRGESMASGLERLAADRLPALLWPRVLGPFDPDMEDEHRLRALFAGQDRWPVTDLAGNASRLVRLLERLRALSGRERVAGAWPELAAVMYTRRPTGMDRARLADAVGSAAVLLLEAWLRPEGILAMEDPRHGLLRLFPDQGVFFEFVPEEQVGQSEPVRHTLADVEPGITYVPALSSTAGVWACLTDDRVCFERRDPPLLRLLDQPALGRTPLRHAASAVPVPPPHSPSRLPFRRSGLRAASITWKV
jgi:hypothetical protein